MEEGIRSAATGVRLSEFGCTAQSEEDTAAMYSPLVLAYLGDAVYELLIRTRLVRAGNRQVNKLHHEAVHYVKAAAQAKLSQLLLNELTEQERAVLKRGRNAHSNTMAKHASMIDYRMATAFEALLGYLWLAGQEERVLELVQLGLARLSEEERKQKQL